MIQLIATNWMPFPFQVYYNEQWHKNMLASISKTQIPISSSFPTSSSSSKFMHPLVKTQNVEGSL